EIALLATCVARDQPVLGICLGAQLLAAGAGGRGFANARPGAGGRPVPPRGGGWGGGGLLGAGGGPGLARRPPRPPGLHWHGDTLDLPAGAVHLASTPVCRHQAFRLGRQVGLQFHCELDPTTIASWVRDDADYVRAAGGPEAGARILADTARL